MMLIGLIISVGGVLLAVVVVLLTHNWELVRHNGTPFLLLLMFWVVIATAPYRGAKRLMKTSGYLSAPVTYTFSSQGVHSAGRHISSDISYEALWAVRETKSLFLLYMSATSALVLPKRFFKDAAQQDDWRILVEQRISPKRIARLGFLGRWL
jgi:YcxB-like protein